MKLWLKYVLAMVCGVVLGALLPVYGGDTGLFFERIFTYMVHIGRYLVFPLLFFTIVVSTYELRIKKQFLHIYGKMFAYTLVSALTLTVIGAIFIAIFSPDRVPIIIEEAAVNLPPSLGEQILMVFPKNLFTVFTGDGDFLLPIIVFATIFGAALFHSQSLSIPIVETFESILQILHNMNRFFLEILSIGIFFMSAYRITQLKNMAELELFTWLLLVILLTVVLIIFLLIPGLLYFLGGRRRNPYTWLFATLPAALSALFSGDNYFTISSSIAALNENMNMDKKTTASIVSLGTVFSRSGTALITCMSFILILRSYSSLDVTFLQYLRVIGSSFVISFMLGAVSGNTIIVSLAILSTWYAQGLEEGFLILLPIAPILTSLGVLLDTIVMLFNCQLTVDRKGSAELPRIKDFI